jgi:nucleotide-binding universal stress UspA family protein
LDALLVDNIYNRIIFATDLGPQSYYIGLQATKLSKICQAQILALHVVEPPITYTANFSERDKFIKNVKTSAEKSLQALCVQLGLSADCQMIRIGTPQEEILNESIKDHCDLIVVGSHGIGGYTHSLGSTAHHLLSEAHCDVLIIQVSHLQKAIETAQPSGLYLWQNPLINPPGTPYVERGPKYSGSSHGFGESIKRGPRPTTRPPKSPKGGTRTRSSEEDDTDNEMDK